MCSYQFICLSCFEILKLCGFTAGDKPNSPRFIDIAWHMRVDVNIYGLNNRLMVQQIIMWLKIFWDKLLFLHKRKIYNIYNSFEMTGEKFEFVETSPPRKSLDYLTITQCIFQLHLILKHNHFPPNFYAVKACIRREILSCGSNKSFQIWNTTSNCSPQAKNKK